MTAKSAAGTPSPACRTALQHATLMWPKRNRKSDGLMGDQAHAKRKSDHNEGSAFDITHDPRAGVDCEVLSQLVIDDPRVQYVIWNRRIYNRDRPGWRTYRGANAHTHHMHVSVKPEARDDSAAWPWSPNFVEWLGRRERRFPTPTPARRRIP